MLKKYPLALKLYAVFVLVFLIAEYHRIGDFEIFLSASEAMSKGHNMYVMFFVEVFTYYYSPLFAILLYPLTLLPFELAGLIWNLLSFILLGRLCWLIKTLYFKHIPFPTNKIFILAFLAALYPIYINFHQTQMSVFILFSIFECIYRCQKKQFIIGALLLALAINIKIMPLVFIPYFLYRRDFKLVIYTILFSILFLLIPILTVGMTENIILHREWFKLLNPFKSKNVIDLGEPQLHSLTSLISSLFTDTFNSYELPIRRHIMLLNHQVVSVIINAVRVFLILGTFYFLRTKPFKFQPNSLSRFWEISYITLLIPLIFPHQQTYAFLLIFPAVIYIVYFLNQGGLKKTNRTKYYVIFSLSIFAFIIINLELLLGVYRQMYWHFKTLTYGVLALLVVLAMCHPKYLENEG